MKGFCNGAIIIQNNNPDGIRKLKSVFEFFYLIKGCWKYYQRNCTAGNIPPEFEGYFAELTKALKKSW